MSGMKYYMQDKRQVVGNCVLFWRHEGKGYTCNINEAHVWTEEEAIKQEKTRPSVDKKWPKEYIDNLSIRHFDCQKLPRDSK